MQVSKIASAEKCTFCDNEGNTGNVSDYEVSHNGVPTMQTRICDKCKANLISLLVPVVYSINVADENGQIIDGRICQTAAHRDKLITQLGEKYSLNTHTIVFTEDQLSR